MDQQDELRALAEEKIVAESGAALDRIGEAAARLLADLYATGLAHGITPQDWAAVTALPGACFDATRAVTRRQQLAAERARSMSGRVPFVLGSAGETHPEATDVRRTHQRIVAPHVGPDQPGRGLGR